MSHFKKPFALLAMSTIAISGFALATPKADTNQDGQITRAEFQAAADAKFAQADTDFDGNLSKDEMRALGALKRAERESKRFDKQDLNGDGALTKAEIETARSQRKAKHEARRLERFDADKNGTVDAAEREAKKAEWRAKREARKAEYGTGERAERKGRFGKRGMRGAKRDADGNGLISRAEYNAASEALFTRMDANSDGVLTKGEGRKRRGRKGKRGH